MTDGSANRHPALERLKPCPPQQPPTRRRPSASLVSFSSIQNSNDPTRVPGQLVVALLFLRSATHDLNFAAANSGAPFSGCHAARRPWIQWRPIPFPRDDKMTLK